MRCIELRSSQLGFVVVVLGAVLILAGCSGNKYVADREKYRHSSDPEALMVPPGLDRSAFGDDMPIPEPSESELRRANWPQIIEDDEPDEITLNRSPTESWAYVAMALERAGMAVIAYDRTDGLLRVDYRAQGRSEPLDQALSKIGEIRFRLEAVDNATRIVPLATDGSELPVELAQRLLDLLRSQLHG